MAKDPHVCTTILTHYRAVAHLVVSVVALLFFVRECLSTYRYEYGTDPLTILWISLVLVGVPELIKGLLLLYSILKENTITLKIYLVFSCIMLLIVKGLVIFYVIIMSAHDMDIVWLFVACFGFYFAFEWFIFYHVCRLHKIVANHVNDEDLRNEQKQIPFHQHEILNINKE